MILLQKTLTDGRYETANTCAFSLKGLAPQVQKLLSIFTAPGTTRPEKIVQHPAGRLCAPLPSVAERPPRGRIRSSPSREARFTPWATIAPGRTSSFFIRNTLTTGVPIILDDPRAASSPTDESGGQSQSAPNEKRGNLSRTRTGRNGHGYGTFVYPFFESGSTYHVLGPSSARNTPAATHLPQPYKGCKGEGVTRSRPLSAAAESWVPNREEALPPPSADGNKQSVVRIEPYALK